MSEESDLLMKARCRLLTYAPFYGHMALSIDWYPSSMGWIAKEDDKKLSIRIMANNNIQVLYYPAYIKTRTIPQLCGEIQHVIEHLVRLHPVRQSSRDKLIWMMATDFSVNGRQNNPRIGYSAHNKTIVPSENMIWCPPGVDDNLTAEQYYTMLEKEIAKSPSQGQGQGQGQGSKNQGKNQKQQVQGQSEQDQEQGQGQGEQGQGQEGNQGQGQGQGQDQGQDQNGSQGDQEKESDLGSTKTPHGNTVDQHDLWGQSQMSEDEMRQVVRDMCQQASNKSQGKVPGHLKELIEALEKPIVKWREVLRRLMGTYVGNKRITYNRRDRRYDNFGKPGISHHAAATVNIIIDTSGSVSSRMLKQFFSEVDQIVGRARCFLLQWDHAFQGYGRYRKGAWKFIEVHGRGGTDMAAPYDWLDKNSPQCDAVIMLTDGECNWPTKREIPTIFVIASEGGHNANPPSWGHVVRMTI